MNNNVKEFRKILETMGTTYEAKNNDYGSAVEILMGEQGLNYIKAILGNKMLRLDTLTTPGVEQKVKDEAITDTLIDIAVYAIEAKRILDKVDRGEELKSRRKYFEVEPIGNLNIDDIKCNNNTNNQNYWDKLLDKSLYKYELEADVNKYQANIVIVDSLPGHIFKVIKDGRPSYIKFRDGYNTFIELEKVDDKFREIDN